MGDDDEIQSDDKIHSGTERFSHFKMDDAFCERMRLAIERGLESAPIGVNTTPEPITPNSQRDMVPSSRSFPPPWTIEELNDACFINGQKLAYVYFEEEPARSVTGVTDIYPEPCESSTVGRELGRSR